MDAAVEAKQNPKHRSTLCHSLAILTVNVDLHRKQEVAAKQHRQKCNDSCKLLRGEVAAAERHSNFIRISNGREPAVFTSAERMIYVFTKHF